jgi:hypothetical protein
MIKQPSVNTPTSGTGMTNWSLLKIFFLFVVIWITVDVWGSWYMSLCFNTINLNKDSTFDRFFIAIIPTILLFWIVFQSSEIKQYMELMTSGEDLEERPPPKRS